MINSSNEIFTIVIKKWSVKGKRKRTNRKRRLLTLAINIENPTTGRKTRIFFYCVKKTLLVNYFQKYTFKVSASSHFCEIKESSKTVQSTKMADGIYPKLYIFITPVQIEGNWPGFHIHMVCNLPFGHSSELKVILK